MNNIKTKTVFISHKSEDYIKAMEICSLLEENGLKCWISERDLDKSTDNWPEEILPALSGSDIVLLILSENVKKNPNQIVNEIGNAYEFKIKVIPYIIENVSIPNELRYYLNPHRVQWIDEVALGKEEAFKVLLKKVGIFRSTVPPAPPPETTPPKPKFLEKENECFNGVSGGSYGFGFDKCLIKVANAGWDPQEVYIEAVDRDEFTFSSIGLPELDSQYSEFCKTSEYQKMLIRGNERERWMLSEVYEYGKIFLSLKKTKWSLLTFWWNQVRDNPEMQHKMAIYAFEMQGAFYPNSLCLHLIVETADEKLVCTKISFNKKNDYSFTIAVTLGEQLNEMDFSSGDTNNNHFIYEWCKRACFEEFGFTNQNYSSYVDESSIRVLALSYEGDIYNFALPTYLKLKITFDDLLVHMQSTPKNNDEFTNVFPMSIDEVVQVLENSQDSEEKKKYHPSSFLRMLLYVAYKDPKRIK